MRVRGSEPLHVVNAECTTPNLVIVSSPARKFTLDTRSIPCLCTIRTTHRNSASFFPWASPACGPPSRDDSDYKSQPPLLLGVAMGLSSSQLNVGEGHWSMKKLSPVILPLPPSAGLMLAIQLRVQSAEVLQSHSVKGLCLHGLYGAGHTTPAPQANLSSMPIQATSSFLLTLLPENLLEHFPPVVSRTSCPCDSPLTFLHVPSQFPLLASELLFQTFSRDSASQSLVSFTSSSSAVSSGLAKYRLG